MSQQSYLGILLSVTFMESTMALSPGGEVLNDSVLVSDLNDSQKSNPTQSLVLNFSWAGSCAEVIIKETADSPRNNSLEAVSLDIQTYARKFQLTLLLILFLIGVPANVINMAVFCKQSLKDRVNLCLFTLSLTDGLFLISCICLNSENIYLHLTTGKTKSHWNAAMVNHNMICFFGTGFISLVLSAIVACERCYCVINPLKFQTVMRTRTMAAIIVSAYILVFGLHFLVAYKYRIGCLYDPMTGRVTTALIQGEFYRAHRDLVDRLEGILFGLGVSGGTMLVVIIATAITTVKLRQLMTWRTESSSSLSSRDVALTKMLIGNSVLFIICAFPACLFRVVWFFLPEMASGLRYHDMFVITLCIVEGSSYINYTCNFFIYYIMGSRYRETFWSLSGRNLHQKKNKT